MTDLIRVTQEKRFSTGLFYRAPGDTQSAEQLINYFKLPESLKARELLQKAFGHQIFPDISVSVFEASLKKFMAKLISPKEFKVLINIASCLRLLKNNKEADEYLRLAEENIVPGQEKEAAEFIENHRRGKLPILL